AAVATSLLLSLSLVGFAAVPNRFRPVSARLSIPLSLSVGALLTGWLVFVAGSLVGTWTALPILGLLVALSLRKAREWLTSLRRVARHLVRLVSASPSGALLLAVPILLLVPALLLPLVDSDGLRYHVALPKLFLMTGRVFRYPWDVTGNYPQTAEMLYMLGLRLGGGETAKFIHTGFFLSSLAVLALAVHRGRSSRSAALVAPFLFAVTPLAICPAPAAFIDHVALFHVATATLLFARGRRALPVGLAAGAAFATKFTALPGVAALALAVLGRSPVPRRRLAAAAVLLPALVAFSPFAVRSLAATGDPIYPMGHGLLGIPIPGVSSSSRHFVTNYHAKTPGALGFAWDTAWGDVEPDDVVGWHHLFGFFALALAVRRPEARLFLPVVLPYVAVALFFHPYTRLLMPLFWGLAFFEASAVVLLARRMAPLAALVLALPALLVSVPRSLFLGKPPLDYLRGRVDREPFLDAWIPGRRAARFVNAQPAGGKVMALDFPAPFAFDRPWVAEGLLDQPPLKLWLDEGADEAHLVSRLRELDIRFVVVTPGYGGGTPASLLPLAESRPQAEALIGLRKRLQLLDSHDGVDVYAVNAPSPPSPP
ncbi:MAG TPA: hypothetical protein VGR00_05540, partial [Thermoanaerobaculia bacterium]|nr:hypothetical protein [Thermoanaerobaculia bacterium]